MSPPLRKLDESTRSSFRATLATVLSALLVATLGLGALWMWGRHQPLSGAADRPLVGEEGRYPADQLAIADLGGAPENYERINDLAGIRALKMLTESELDVYVAAGAQRAKINVTLLNGGKATVLLIRARDRLSARAAARELADLQLSFGFQAVAAPDGVAAAKLTAKPDVLPGGRAHYAHEDIVARVEMRGDDQRQAHDQFDHVLRQQLEALSADG